MQDNKANEFALIIALAELNTTQILVYSYWFIFSSFLYLNFLLHSVY